MDSLIANQVSEEERLQTILSSSISPVLVTFATAVAILGILEFSNLIQKSVALGYNVSIETGNGRIVFAKGTEEVDEDT